MELRDKALARLLQCVPEADADDVTLVVRGLAELGYSLESVPEEERVTVATAIAQATQSVGSDTVPDVSFCACNHE